MITTEEVRWITVAVKSLWSIFEESMSARADAADLRRLLVLELRRNSGIVSGFNLGEEIAQNDPSLIELARVLDTSVLERILIVGHEDGRDCLRGLENITLPEPDGESTTDHSVTVRDATEQLYLRIITLKVLAEVDRSGQAVRDTRFRTRLSNIKVLTDRILKACR
jgi:hypothetical protein